MNGQAIARSEVDSAVADKIASLEQQIYALRKSSLDGLIVRRLLEGEAAKKGVTVDELKKQFMGGAAEVTAAEVEKEYQNNISVFASMGIDEAKEQIRADLETRVRMRRYREAVAALRNAAQIAIHLESPLPAELRSPTRGKSDAPVAITVFSDFGCPHCRTAGESLRRIHEQHPKDVKVTYRHYPLNAATYEAARASVCADEQGRFWEFHDTLFASGKSTKAQVDAVVAALSLDIPRFTQCMASERSREIVAADVAEGKRLGVTGTPTFLLNGEVVRGALDLDSLQQSIAPAGTTAERKEAP